MLRDANVDFSVHTGWFQEQGASVGKPPAVQHQAQAPETAAALAPWSVHRSPAPAAAEACSGAASAWAWARRGLGRQRGPRKNHPWTWLHRCSPLRQVPATTRQPATHEFPPCHAPFPPSKSHENSPRLPAVHQNVSSTLAHHRSCDRHRRRRCCGHPRYASHVASSRTPTTHSSSPLRSARSLKVPRD